MKVSYKSFFLGLGIGLILSSSINILSFSQNSSNNTANYTELDKKEFVNYSNEDYIILLIDSNTSKEEVLQEFLSNGINLNYDETMRKMDNRELRKGLFKIDKNESVDQIIEKITMN